MRYLIYSIILTLNAACSSDYRLMTPGENFRCPQIPTIYPIENTWFTTTVDVAGRHISGLLLIKKMEDNSRRVVFTSESGLTFFDFEFASTGDFIVHHIVKMMDKKAVISTLRKDFDLLLGNYFQSPAASMSRMNNELYIGSQKNNETAYLVLADSCNSLLRLELASARTKKVTVESYPDFFHLPDSIHVRHYTFDMNIHLVQLVKN